VVIVVWNARLRLACLWLSQVGRVMADNCLRVFVLLAIAPVEGAAAWHLVTALLMLPAVLLSPLNGALGNSLPKRWVLVGSAAFCLGVVGLWAGWNAAWLGCWALVAVGNAVYSPTRYALLPAAAEDTRVPLTRVNGWIEMGAGAAIVSGMILGGHLHLYRFADPAPSWLQPVPVAVGLCLALNLLGVLAALPVWFRSDVRRPESAGQAVAGFFRDARRVLTHGEARLVLLTMAGFRGLVAAATGALLAPTFSQGFEQVSAAQVQDLIRIGVWVAAGVAAGSLLAGVQGHPRRALGLVPLGAVGLLAGLVLAALGSSPSGGLGLFLGLTAGLINVPLSAAYQAALPADARGNGMAVRNLADYVAMTVMSVLMYLLAHHGVLTAGGQFWLVAALAGLGVGATWYYFFREGMEQLIEFVAWPMFRIRARGPGLERFPRQGPLLVIANHSCWFDPLFLAKVLPRRLMVMMTSQFYDLPGMRWFFKHVVHAIRVQASTYRREAPELYKAVAQLDRGQCVVIFPEGAMRRREGQPLKLFGQGVWHILNERPQTPVVVCWIEGAWGSYTSYWKGPPTANKRLDFWRHIDVAVGEPQFIDEALLKDQRATRLHLMQACLETRRHLGLEPLKLERFSEGAEEAEEAKKDGDPTGSERA
jgi:1-acyl-sn-glycerol-3-phosphate acyltransferase